KRVASEGELLDFHFDLLRPRQAWSRLRGRRQNRLGGRWQSQRLARLLENLARVRPLLRVGESACQREKHQAEPRRSSPGARAMRARVGNKPDATRRRA